MNCAFCKIADDLPRWSLVHGPDVVSFKPFGAVNPGHRLFIPAEHIASATDNPELCGKVFAEAARWAADKRRAGADFNLIVNNGPNADQTVFHLHVHYVPRTSTVDGLGYRWRA